MAVYMKVTGTKQGVFAGGVSTKGHEGKVNLNSLELGVAVPHDISTGQATGRRIYRPVTVTKNIDKSSPLFMTALSTNETLQLEIKYVFEGGKTDKSIATLSFTNAMVRDFKHSVDHSASGIETIQFTFTKYEFTWDDGGIMAADDFTAHA